MMDSLTRLEFVGQLPLDTKAQLCEQLDEDGAWEKVVHRFWEVKIRLFSVQELSQEKYPSSPGQRLLQLLMHYNFKLSDVYKTLATLRLFKVMDVIKKHVNPEVIQKVEEALKRSVARNETMDSIVYIYQLPEDIRRELCAELDGSDIWKFLLGKFEDAGFRWTTINQCQVESPKSPSSELLKQLADRNFKIALLYVALASLKAVKAMSLLECYVSESLSSSVSLSMEKIQDCSKKQNNDNTLKECKTSSALVNYTRSVETAVEKTVESHPLCSRGEKSDINVGLNVMSYAQLQKATDDWNCKRCLDCKLKRNFYHGEFMGTDVAIKRLRNMDNGEELFARLRVLRSLDCKYLLKMLMFTEGDIHPCLIYPFKENGSLYDVLKHGVKSSSSMNDICTYLTWKNKGVIAKGVAEAFLYLHTSLNCQIFVKSSDVILDDNLDPLVADVNLTTDYGDKQYQPLCQDYPKEYLDGFCLGTLLLELLIAKTADSFGGHPETVFAKTRKFLKSIGKCDKAGKPSDNVKRSWSAIVAVCFDGKEIDDITNFLRSAELWD